MALSATSTDAAGSISLQSFLKILTTQLTHQDPLKPMDNQEFITQMAQFAALEQSRELNGQISQMFSMQATTQSVGLLGKEVFFEQNGQTGSGVVSALSFSNGAPSLSITTASQTEMHGVTLGQLVRVREPQ
jgi:flagellar basal-body rod modification protein FlgD